MNLLVFSHEILNYYQSQFIIVSINSKLIKTMFDKQNTTQEAIKQNNRKDFLYKIGKLRQNRILNGKQNEHEYAQEEQKKQAHKIFQFDEEEFQQDMIIPFTQQYQTPKTILKTNQEDEEIQSVNLELKQKRVEKNIQIKPIATNQNNEEKKQEIISQTKSQSSRKVEQSLSPFTFDDIEDNQQNEKNESIQQKQKSCSQEDKQKSQSESNLQSSQSQGQSQIKGMSLTSSLQGNVIINITNKKQLVLSRLPPGIILKCLIRKSTNIYNPQFDFYLNNGPKHIISAKKYSLAKKQIFQLSLQLGKYEKRNVIGSIMANTIHNIYQIYQQDFNKQTTKYQLKGIVSYGKMIKHSHREMKVNLYINDQNEITDTQKMGQQTSKGLTLENCELPEKQSSIKNFCLYDEQDKQYKYLKMTKTFNNMFEVQIQHPFSPMQAFSICLTRFDAQLK